MAEWKVGDPVPAQTEESVRLSFGDWMRRRREDVGLTQVEAAGRLGVSQQVVSKCERTGVATEGLLFEMWGLYAVPEHYLAAPRDPLRRREWFAARNTRSGAAA